MLRYNIYSERGDGEGRIVTEAGPSGHWMRYTDHVAVRDALVQALEAIVLAHTQGGGYQAMAPHIAKARAALALAKDNTNHAP